MGIVVTWKNRTHQFYGCIIMIAGLLMSNIFMNLGIKYGHNIFYNPLTGQMYEFVQYFGYRVVLKLLIIVAIITSIVMSMLQFITIKFMKRSEFKKIYDKGFVKFIKEPEDAD